MSCAFKVSFLTKIVENVNSNIWFVLETTIYTYINLVVCGEFIAFSFFNKSDVYLYVFVQQKSLITIWIGVGR